MAKTNLDKTDYVIDFDTKIDFLIKELPGSCDAIPAADISPVPQGQFANQLGVGSSSLSNWRNGRLKTGDGSGGEGKWMVPRYFQYVLALRYGFSPPSHTSADYDEAVWEKWFGHDFNVWRKGSTAQFKGRILNLTNSFRPLNDTLVAAGVDKCQSFARPRNPSGSNENTNQGIVHNPAENKVSQLVRFIAALQNSRQNINSTEGETLLLVAMNSFEHQLTINNRYQGFRLRGCRIVYDGDAEVLSALGWVTSGDSAPNQPAEIGDTKIEFRSLTGEKSDVFWELSGLDKPRGGSFSFTEFATFDANALTAATVSLRVLPYHIKALETAEAVGTTERTKVKAYIKALGLIDAADGKNDELVLSTQIFGAKVHENDK